MVSQVVPSSIQFLQEELDRVIPWCMHCVTADVPFPWIPMARSNARGDISGVDMIDDIRGFGSASAREPCLGAMSVSAPCICRMNQIICKDAPTYHNVAGEVASFLMQSCDELLKLGVESVVFVWIPVLVLARIWSTI